MWTISSYCFLALLSLQLISSNAASISVSSCADLNKAIGRVNKGEKLGEIQIPKGVTIRMASCKGMTKITRSISITGLGSPPPKITGENQFQLFYLNARGIQLTLKNLIVLSGKGSNGGCAFISSSSRALFSSVGFQNCTGTFGGAIFNNGSISLNSVNFIYNSAYEGGSIWSSQDLKINRSKFTSNFAEYGGAIFSAGAIDLNFAEFISNYADFTGGAIYINSNKFSSILNSLFSKNSVGESIDPANGGAIYSLSRLNIANSNFVDNFAHSDSTANGGALYLTGPTYIQRSKFSKNHVSTHEYTTSGGAIRSTSSLQVSFSNFEQNYARSLEANTYGGAINVDGDCTILSSNFSRNYISSDISESLGGAIHSSLKLTTTSSIFSNNSINLPDASGGAIYAFELFAYSTSFFINKIEGINVYGGAVYVASYGLIRQCVFTSNSLISTGVAQGGAIFFRGESKKTQSISISSFSFNSVAGRFGDQTPFKSELNGGAVYSKGKLNDVNNKYERNSVIENGMYDNPFIPGDYFLTVRGGAIFGEKTVKLESSTFIRNQVKGLTSNAGGGAIATTDFLTILNSSFISNFAVSDCNRSCGIPLSGGGAIFNNFGSLIQSSKFENNYHQSKANNTFSSGGAIFFSSSSSYFSSPSSSSSSKSHQVLFCSFNNNSATSTLGTSRGGAISAYSFAGVSRILNSNFVKNLAKGSISNGGAVYLEGRRLFNSNCTFTENSATSSAGDANGGALALFGLDAANPILFASFVRNKAVSESVGFAKGGAIYQGYSSRLSFPLLPLSHAIFDRNSAQGRIGARGGALYMKASHSLSCSYSSFSNSIASAAIAEGGAIYASNFSILNFCKGNKFASNNRIATTGKSPKLSSIFTGISVQVNFCPTNPIPVEHNSSFTPKLDCGGCDCSAYFNPCDSLATCKRSSNTLSTTCACPSNKPGNGFTCRA